MAYGSVNVPGRLTAGDVNAVPLSGGIMTGPLFIPTPTQPQHAANKDYVDLHSGLPPLAKIIVQDPSTGGITRNYNVELEGYSTSGGKYYKLDFSSTLTGNGKTFYITLEPPEGYGFTLGSNTGDSLPYLRIYDSSGNALTNLVPGSLSPYGTIVYTIAASLAASKFKFVSSSTTDFALVVMEVA